MVHCHEGRQAGGGAIYELMQAGVLKAYGQKHVQPTNSSDMLNYCFLGYFFSVFSIPSLQILCWLFVESFVNCETNKLLLC